MQEREKTDAKVRTNVLKMVNSAGRKLRKIVYNKLS